VFLLEFNLHACNFIGWENGGMKLVVVFERERREKMRESIQFCVC
jgi:hypothetical protein